MRRLPAVTKETMKPEQLDLFGKITSGPRSKGRNAMDFLDQDGGLIGPFNAYLYTPKIGDAAQPIGRGFDMDRLRSELEASRDYLFEAAKIERNLFA